MRPLDELWEEDDCWVDEPPPPAWMPNIRTPAYLAARKRRVARLRQEIEAGTYRIPAEKVAWHFLYGRLRWGESLIDENGMRLDEQGRR